MRPAALPGRPAVLVSRQTETRTRPMSDDAEVKRLLERLISLVEAVARDMAAVKADLAEIKTVQSRHGARLSVIDTYLDEQGSALDGLMRP